MRFAQYMNSALLLLLSFSETDTDTATLWSMYLRKQVVSLKQCHILNRSLIKVALNFICLLGLGFDFEALVLLRHRITITSSFAADTLPHAH